MIHAVAAARGRMRSQLERGEHEQRALEAEAGRQRDEREDGGGFSRDEQQDTEALRDGAARGRPPERRAEEQQDRDPGGEAESVARLRRRDDLQDEHGETDGEPDRESPGPQEAPIVLAIEHLRPSIGAASRRRPLPEVMAGRSRRS